VGCVPVSQHRTVQSHGNANGGPCPRTHGRTGLGFELTPLALMGKWPCGGVGPARPRPRPPPVSRPAVAVWGVMLSPLPGEAGGMFSCRQPGHTGVLPMSEGSILVWGGGRTGGTEGREAPP